jgi:hypothetical protein
MNINHFREGSQLRIWREPGGKRVVIRLAHPTRSAVIMAVAGWKPALPKTSRNATPIFDPGKASLAKGSRFELCSKSMQTITYGFRLW